MREAICSIVVLFLLFADPFVVFVNCQETNFYNATSYVDNVSFRSNFCPLHRLAESGELSLKDALRGQQISVGLFRYQLNEDETGEYRINELNPGAGIRFLDELASRAGFTWRDTFGILDSPKSAANQTWGGLLEWSVDTYDLVGDWYLRTIERLGNGIVFPEGWYDGSLIMVRRKPEDNFSYDIWAFAKPFTGEVWLLIICTTVASGLVYFLLDYINTGGQKEKMEFNLFESLYFASIGFVGHLIHLPRTMAGQVLTFSVCFLFLMIVAAYTANLASFLVVRNTPTLIINDITDAIKSDLSFCVLKSSTSELTLRNDYKSARIVQRDSIRDTYLSVVAGECDLVLTTFGTWKKYERNIEFNKGCSREWVGRVVMPFVAGFSLRDSATSCSSMLRDVLSIHMIDMKLDRTDIVIWDKLLSEKATINCQAEDPSANDPDKNKLSIYNLGGIFIAHLAATTVAIGLAVLNWWFRRSKSSHISARINTGSGLPSSSHGSEDGNGSQSSTPPEITNSCSGNASSSQNPRTKNVKANHRASLLKPMPQQQYLNDTSFIAPNAYLDSLEQKKKDLVCVVAMAASVITLKNSIKGSLRVSVTGGSTSSLPDGLKHLQYFDVSSNEFSGEIPDLGALRSLSYVDISNNLLEGGLTPGGVLRSGHLGVDPWPELIYINASSAYAKSSGHRRGLDEDWPFYNSKKLELIDLSRNQFSGGVPDLSAATKLIYLDLSKNLLEGGLTPGGISRDLGDSWEELTYLDLSKNKLGAIDDSGSSFGSPLRSGLDGDWPFYNSKKLKHVDLSANRFSGGVPDLSAATKLSYLDLSSNLLEGGLTTAGVSRDLGDSWEELTYLDLSRNKLGAIDDSGRSLRSPLRGGLDEDWPFYNSKKLKHVDLSANRFSGGVPDLSAAISLSYLNVSNNLLEGGLPTGGVSRTLPDNLGQKVYEELVSADFSNNNITVGGSGLAEDWPFYNSRMLKHLDLSRNRFAGDMPNLTALESLSYLNISRNQLEGRQTGGIYGGLKNLQYLDASNNQFTGGLPDLSATRSLSHLDLSNNRLEGGLTTGGVSRMGRMLLPDNLGDLTYLDLSNNNLGGSGTGRSSRSPPLGLAEDWPFYSSKKLKHVDLSRNQFTGSIPDLSPARSLSHLDLSYNQPKGCLTRGDVSRRGRMLLPDNLGDLTYLDLSNNNLGGYGTGRSLHSLPQCGLAEDWPFYNSKKLEHIDLSRNQFTGTVPDGLDNLSYLSFSGNRLEGLDNFNNYQNVENLDLSDTALTIAPDMTVLTRITV